MIRPLRQRHRHVVIALGVFLPVAFALGVAARKAVPVAAQLPAVLVGAPQRFEVAVWERADLFAKAPVQVRLLKEQGGAGRFGVGLSAAKDFVKPDLIVYWVAGNPTLTDALPADAVLLGTFGTRVLPLPDAVAKAGGVLILFSLADNEMVDVSKPVELPNN